MSTQKEAIEAITSGRNVFLTGGGGVGKSWVVSQIQTENTVLLAPTGVAALNVGGQTCHSFFRLPIGLPQKSDFETWVKPLKSLIDSGIDRIIIDEIGMVRADMLCLMDARMRKHGHKDLPFGGVQVIMVGDFYQLEPIVNKNEKRFFNKDYETPFAFSSPVWGELALCTVNLTEVKRQSDQEQIKLLNSIRKKDENYLKSLEQINQISGKADMEAVSLCFYKSDAEIMNTFMYEKLNTEEIMSEAEVFGKVNPNEVPVPEQLYMREGAKVVICANEKVIPGEEPSYVNGTQGVIAGFRTVQEVNEKGEAVEASYVVVTTDEGYMVQVPEFTWSKFSYKSKSPTDIRKEKKKREDDKENCKKLGKKYVPKPIETVVKEEVGYFKQFPILMGWAITVHKSQGMTLDKCRITRGRGAFSHGQMYVALSRCRDLTNMSLATNIQPCDVISHSCVKEFMGDMT